MGGVNLRITGAEDLAAAAKRIRAAGDGGLRKELLASIRAEVKPTVEAIKANTSILPQRGGLAAKLRKGIGVRTATGGQRVGVRIVQRHAYSVRQINRGRLRHPTWGHRDRWVTQSVRPGYFDEPIEKDIDRLRHGVIRAVDRVNKKVEG